MTSIESEARGISERHWDGGQGPGRIGVNVCEGCGHSWPCPDRLAADAITNELAVIRRRLERIRDRETANWNFTSEPGIQKCDCYEDSRANIWDAVAALASLTGDKT